MNEIIISKLERLDEKLDIIDRRVDSVDVTLAKQEVSLSEHIRRTNMLEEKMIPMSKNHHQAEGVLKFVGVMSLIIGIVSGILAVLH